MYFEEDGKVSVWVGQIKVEPGTDFLKHKFGAEDYDLDFQDCIVADSPSSFPSLVSRLSYSNSFSATLVEAAKAMQITDVLWVLAQYNYNYDPSRSGMTQIPTEPRFIGVFDWHE